MQPSNRFDFVILLGAVVALFLFSSKKDQGIKPDPKPDQKVVVTSDLTQKVKKAFGDNKQDALKYAAFYAALADSLEKGSATHIQTRTAAEQALKEMGYKTGYLTEVLRTQFDEYKNLSTEAQWTTEVKASHIQKWRELSTACLKASE